MKIISKILISLVLLVSSQVVFGQSDKGKEADKVINMINKRGFWRPAVQWLEDDDRAKGYISMIDDFSATSLKETKKSIEREQKDAQQLLDVRQLLVKNAKKPKKQDELLAQYFNDVSVAKNVFDDAEKVVQRCQMLTAAIDGKLANYVPKTMPKGNLLYFSSLSSNGFAGFHEEIILEKKKDGKRILSIDSRNRRMEPMPNEQGIIVLNQPQVVEVDDTVFQRVRDMVEKGRLYDVGKQYMPDYMIMDASNWSMSFTFEGGKISSGGYAGGPDNSKALREIVDYLKEVAKSIADSKLEAYLFTSFREPSTQGLEYLYSYDGLRWDTIPGVFMQPMVGNEKSYRDAFTKEVKWPTYAPEQKCLRDPSIVQGPDGTYHLVWTVQWSGNRTFGYASSTDLIHWSEQREIPVMKNIPTNNVWAPELFYDDVKEQFLVIWSSQINPKYYTKADRKGTNNCHRMWYTTTKDFKTFTPAKRYYDPGFNSIDGYLLKRAPKDYVLIVKDNRKPGYSDLFCVFSDSPYGPFRNPTAKFGRTYSEGPCAIMMDDGEWIIYYDQYHPQEYGAVSTRDFKTFTPIPERISVPAKHKHGTILKINGTTLRNIIQAGQSKH